MAFNYSTVRWIINGELIDQTVQNRPISDLAELVSTYLNDQMYTIEQINENFYDKTHIDETFPTKTHLTDNHYTKVESNLRFMLKTDVGTGFYTKDEIDDNFYTKTTSDARYYGRDHIDDSYYTKSQVEALMEGYEPEQRVRDIQLDQSHIYSLTTEDINSAIVFYGDANGPSTLTLNIPEADFGTVGDTITLIAPDELSFTDGDEAFAFISSVSGTVYTPRVAEGLLPAFRSGGSVATLKKVSSVMRGMGDWVLYGDLALYTAADLWVDVITRADLIIQQAGLYVDHILVPYQDGGVWKWKPLSFAKNVLVNNTTRITRTTGDNADTVRIQSTGEVEDFSSFVIVTKPIPRNRSIQLTSTTSTWSQAGSAYLNFMESVPETPDDILTERNFTGNRTYTSDVSLQSAPVYIGVRNVDPNVKATDIRLSINFTN